MKKEFLYSSLVIFIFSLFSLKGLLLNPIPPETFDGRAHITSIAQFSHAMKEGNFPVVWLDHVANYGAPSGIYVQQLPIYTGALLSIFLSDPYLAYVIVLFVSVFLSGIFFYRFLRLYTSPLSSLMGVLLLTCAPFRITDIYVRGDLPEVFSSMFLPLILFCMYHFIVNKQKLALFGLILSLTGLILSHPLALVIYSFIYIAYFFFLLYQKWRGMTFLKNKKSIVSIIYFCLALGLAFGISSYYFLPLTIETKKYLLYFLLPTHFDKYQILGWSNFFSPIWEGRVTQYIKVGTLELGVVVGFFIYELSKVRSKKISFGFAEFIFCLVLIYLFFLSKFSYSIFEHTFLGEVQYAWRMLLGFIFLPPILLALLMEKMHKKWILALIVILLCTLRIPQFSGKTFVNHPPSYYEFANDNVYAPYLNTIWIEKPESYPRKMHKAEILEHGKGEILSQEITNTKRIYRVAATERLHMIDYTFYFPGWKVFIDGKPTEIEFQNSMYRGVITYFVPTGEHTILVTFEDTLLRRIGKSISLVSLGFFALLVIFRNRLPWLVLASKKTNH